MRFINDFFVPMFLALSCAVAQGSILVGNGGGIVEQNIIYAYESLPQAIQSCLNLREACDANPKDVQVLMKIQAIAERNFPGPNRIRFASERARPGFFDTEVGQAFRLAKTGLTPQAPIYWNTDELYRPDGTPALDIPAITAIWIHELGHQAGLTNHTYLDGLGARVRRMLLDQISTLDYRIGVADLKVTAINYPGVATTADLYLVDGSNSTRLSSAMAKTVQCSDPGSAPLGWSLVNLHWDSQIRTRENGPSVLPLSAWLEVRCSKGEALSQSIEDFHLRLVFENRGGALRFLRAEPVKH